MFKHILLPVDGSRLALKGAKAGIRLAKALRARVTAVYVIPPFTPVAYGDAAVYVPGLSPQEYKQATEKGARKALAAVEAEAKKSRVRCKSRFLTTARVHEGLLRAARAANCDAIAMASHGRGGLAGVLLGSETTRVLAHSKVPVLVLR
ncbi:MAG: universal stress protein [Betaproteobacteria bacterium]|nr:universal stress protein [Betaproteobacteria bacterium]MDH5579302.1 universal stress protein [Betaproteobacteria bacterium]